MVSTVATASPTRTLPPLAGSDVADLDTVAVVDVALAHFTAYESAGLPAWVRVFGPDVAVPSGQKEEGRLARNLEPE